MAGKKNTALSLNQDFTLSVPQNAALSDGTAPRSPVTASTENAVRYQARADQTAQSVNRQKLAAADTRQAKNALDAWRDTTQTRTEAQTDAATRQGVLDLSRAQADAEGAYQSQLNRIDAEEARAKDNQALYAAARGDRGGIGAAQYDSVMNAAMNNRQQVYSARAALASSTARQIADLRAQGEYQKADAALELAQTYLSRLKELEQWEQEYNLDVSQFNARLDQWLADYQSDRADAERKQAQQAWENAFNQQKYSDSQAQQAWENAFNQQKYSDSKAQQAWENAFNQRKYTDSQAQQAWENTFNQRKYTDSQAQQAWENAFNQQRYSDSQAQQAWENSFNQQRYSDSQAQQAWENSFNQQKYSDSQAQQALQNTQNQQKAAQAQAEARRKQLASTGETLLKAGIIPSASQLEAMGLTREAAARYAAAVNAGNG